MKKDKIRKIILILFIIFILFASFVVFIPTTQASNGDDGEPFHYWYAPDNTFGVSYMKLINTSYLENWTAQYFKVWLNASANNITWYNASAALTEVWDWSHENDNNIVKLSWIINTSEAPQALYYRLTAAVDARAKNYINNTGNHSVSFSFNVSNNETYDLMLNWSDIIPLIQNNTVFYRHGIKKINNNSYFWARIQSVNQIPVGTVFVIDPTFGKTNTTGAGNVIIEDRLMGSAFYCPSNGTLNNFTAFLKSSAQHNVKCAIYDNSTRELIGGSDERTIDTGGIYYWFTFNITGTIDVNDTAEYLLVVWSNDIGSDCRVRSLSDFSHGFRDLATYNGFPDPYVQDLTFTSQITIYCNYTERAPPVVDHNASPVISSFWPTNNTATICPCCVELNITTSQTNGTLIDIYFYTNYTGVWGLLDHYDDVTPNASYAIMIFNFTKYNTNYYINVSVYNYDNTSKYDQENITYTTAQYINCTNVTATVDAYTKTEADDLFLSAVFDMEPPIILLALFMFLFWIGNEKEDYILVVLSSSILLVLGIYYIAAFNLISVLAGAAVLCVSVYGFYLGLAFSLKSK